MATPAIKETRVFDLRNERVELWYDLPPKEAVRNAHALFELGDGETWNYGQYDSLVFEGDLTVGCGHYCAWKDGEKPSQEVIDNYVKSITR